MVRERRVHVRLEHLGQSNGELEEGSRRLDFARQGEVFVRREHDAAGTGGRRKVHQVQAVVRLQPQVRDQQVGWLVEQPGTGRAEIRANVDIGDEPQRRLDGARAPDIRVDHEGLFESRGRACPRRHEIGIVVPELARGGPACGPPHLSGCRSAGRDDEPEELGGLQIHVRSSASLHRRNPFKASAAVRRIGKPTHVIEGPSEGERYRPGQKNFTLG